MVRTEITWIKQPLNPEAEHEREGQGFDKAALLQRDWQEIKRGGFQSPLNFGQVWYDEEEKVKLRHNDWEWWEEAVISLQ